MGILILGLLVFFAAHLLPVFAGLRARAVSRLGEGTYKGVFALVSLVGLVLIIYGFGAARAAGSPLIWDPPAGMRHLAMVLMLPVFVLVLAAYLPGRIKARLKHPMLVGVKLWALAHLLANGDLASMVLFGTFLAWAVVDRISVKRRPGAAAAAVVAVPRPRNDAIAVVGGLAIYLAFVFWLHAGLIGVPVVG